MHVGKMALAADGSNPYYAGNIRTLSINLPRFVFRQMADPRSGPDAPKWEVAIQLGGEWVVIGAGWEKEIQRGDHSGETMFTITMDAPEWDKPLNLAAFPVGGNEYELVFKRARRQVHSAGAGLPADDEIPF